MSEDKRRYPRADLAFELSYAVSGPGNKSRARDLSEGGISFMTAEELPPNANLVVQLALPGADGHVEATARVIRSWRDNQGQLFAAAKFVEVDEVDLGIIKRFIEMQLMEQNQEKP
ncbi:MAG: PilZ domain-containing protein [Spirochaetales bacterium]|nr:PilZ domain-containing protein [Leptospiraceae bacterium]MCP5480186.1 PilZ domain-containing protein [Spirochaetales bacterium]